MVIVQNRELLFSNREQYIGTTFDNNSEVRLFSINRISASGIDISDLSFRLDLKYIKNGKVDTCILDKVVTDDKILLTWVISSGVLQVSGPVFINIRATDSTGTVKWASYQAVVYVEEAINTPGTYTGGLTELEQLEKRVEEKTITLDANEGTRQSNETKRQQDTAAAIKKADEATLKANNATTGVEAAIVRVNTAATGAEAAIKRANDAAGNTEQAIKAANTAAGAANTAATDVNTAKNNANTAAGAANTAASNADNKAGVANTAASNADNKASMANTAAGAANTAAGAANTAAGAANTAAGVANTAAGVANTAASNADNKASMANTAAGAANTAATDVNTAKNNANTAAGAANTAAGAANTAAGAANTAAVEANKQGNYAKTQGDAAALVAAGAVAQNGGDISNTVTTMDTIQEMFPTIVASDRTKTIIGKIKKSIDDWKSIKNTILTLSQIKNDFNQISEGTVADGRLAKTLKDLIDINTTGLADLLLKAFLKSDISNIQMNATDKVPTSALIYAMQQAITANETAVTKLNSDLGLKFPYWNDGKFSDPLENIKTVYSSLEPGVTVGQVYNHNVACAAIVFKQDNTWGGVLLFGASNQTQLVYHYLFNGVWT